MEKASGTTAVSLEMFLPVVNLGQPREDWQDGMKDKGMGGAKEGNRMTMGNRVPQWRKSKDEARGERRMKDEMLERAGREKKGKKEAVERTVVSLVRLIR